MSQIGKNIKKIRNVKALSQQAFAEIFELTRGNISSYEEFRAEPRIEVIVRIANYFGIPLSDFIEKDLSVNELLHFNAELVAEAEKLKITGQLTRIPYIPVMYRDDFLNQYADLSYIQKLPVITVPIYSKLRLLAFEIEDPESLPSGFDYMNGDILIFEQVVKENMHRIIDKLGLMIDKDGLRSGVYKAVGEEIELTLNEWVNYPFDIESGSEYWVMRALYTQSV